MIVRLRRAVSFSKFMYSMIHVCLCTVPHICFFLNNKMMIFDISISMHGMVQCALNRCLCSFPTPTAHNVYINWHFIPFKPQLFTRCRYFCIIFLENAVVLYFCLSMAAWCTVLFNIFAAGCMIDIQTVEESRVRERKKRTPSAKWDSVC